MGETLFLELFVFNGLDFWVRQSWLGFYTDKCINHSGGLIGELIRREREGFSSRC